MVACFPEDNIARNPETCYNEAANFLVDLDWKSYIDLAEEIPIFDPRFPDKSLSSLVKLVKDANESSVPPQNVLFGLPFYYVGK